MKLKEKNPEVNYTEQQLTAMLDQVLADIQLHRTAFDTKYADFEIPEEIIEVLPNVLTYIINYICTHKLHLSSTHEFVNDNLEDLLEFFGNAGVKPEAANDALFKCAEEGYALGIKTLLMFGADPMAVHPGDVPKETPIDAVFRNSDDLADDQFQLAFYAVCAAMLTDDDKGNQLLKFMVAKHPKHPLSKLALEAEKATQQELEKSELAAFNNGNTLRDAKLSELEKQLTKQNELVLNLQKQVNDLSQQVKEVKQKPAEVVTHHKKGFLHKFG